MIDILKHKADRVSRDPDGINLFTQKIYMFDHVVEDDV